MALNDIILDKITEQDLQRLKDAGTLESLYIDYKRQTYGGSEAEHVEFLADVSSFANTVGGDLVIGMAEAKGVPTAIVPFTGNVDEERRRLEEIARTGLEPRIRNLRVQTVPLTAGGHVIIVRVPRSFLPPHRVTYRGRHRFWARASSGKYEPNVEELRRLFTEAPRLTERVQSFRMDRIAKITAGETPIPLSSSGKIVLHVVPFPAFSDGRLIDIMSAVAAGTHVPLPLDGISNGNRHGVNLEGFVNYTDNVPGAVSGYAQLFRSGAVEGVSELSRRESDNVSYFWGAALANKVVAALRQYIRVLKSYDAGIPIYAGLSLCGADQWCFRYSPAGMGYNDVGPIHRNAVILPDIMIDTDFVDVTSVTRLTFDMLWNAFGFQRCDLYDDQGQWIGAKQYA